MPTVEQVYDLTLLETDDEAAAARAASDHAAAVLRAGGKPE